MAVSMRQSLRLGAYLLKQKRARRKKFPLVVDLESLFACNFFFFSSRRRHTRSTRDWIQTCALPISRPGTRDYAWFTRAVLILRRPLTGPSRTRGAGGPGRCPAPGLPGDIPGTP